MIDNLTTQILEKVMLELDKNDNKEFIDNKFIKPLCENISNKIHPYMLIIFVSYIIILILIIWIMFLLIRKLE